MSRRQASSTKTKHRAPTPGPRGPRRSPSSSPRRSPRRQTAKKEESKRTRKEQKQATSVQELQDQLQQTRLDVPVPRVDARMAEYQSLCFTHQGKEYCQEARRERTSDGRDSTLLKCYMRDEEGAVQPISLDEFQQAQRATQSEFAAHNPYLPPAAWLM